MKRVSLFAALLISSAVTFAQTWNVDKGHSTLAFTYTHLGIAELGGTFGIKDGKFTSSKPDFTDAAAVEFTGDITSINTGNEQRDKHLKNADFFDAEKFPTFTFKGNSWKKVSDKKYTVTGDFTMHGVTKPVTLNVLLNGTTTHPMSKKQVAGFTVTGVVKRTDFGISPNTPSAMVGDDVKLIANLEFAKD